MTTVFYTYVWGSNPNLGVPLTFTANHHRAFAAKRATVEQDAVVFGVCSTNPQDPKVVISEHQRGRVLSAWRLSRIAFASSDYGIGAQNTWDVDENGAYRWPYALPPLDVWAITAPPRFRDLLGYTPRTHTQRAITSTQEVNPELAESLLALIPGATRLKTMMPRFSGLAGRVQRLRQQHPFRINGYEVAPRDMSALVSVYVAELVINRRRYCKIGHAVDPKTRLAAFNAYRVSSEPQWHLKYVQPIGTEQEAIRIEHQLGAQFEKHRTEQNGEIFSDLDADVPGMALLRHVR